MGRIPGRRIVKMMREKCQYRDPSSQLKEGRAG
jgi:hypothetical protein